MSRTDKLFSRLDDLELDFAKLLVKEFQCCLDGGYSTYFSRKIPHFFDGKGYVDTHIATLEKMEKEILQLHEKLGSSPDAGPVALLYRYHEENVALKKSYEGGVVRLQRKYLARLQSLIDAK